MKILTSWDDGHELDVKVMELLRKYNLPGIFFVPIQSWGFENLDKYEGFEIGGHTFTHPQDLKKLNHRELFREIYISTGELKKKLGKTPEWFCYPRGRYNDAVRREVQKAGYKYARTTRVGLGVIPSYYYEIGGLHCYHEIGGLHCYQRREYGGIDWLDYIKEAIEANKELGSKMELHIWGHSHEINKYQEWDKLEELLKYVNENCNR